MKRRKKLVAKLWNPDFVYTPAVATNLSETFARVRERLKQADEAQVKVLAGEIKRRVA